MYVFLKLIILRLHPHFTRHIRKKSTKPSAFYTFENTPAGPQIRILPETMHCYLEQHAAEHQRRLLGKRGYPVVSIPTVANSHTSDSNRNTVQQETQPDKKKHSFIQTSEDEFCCLHSTSSRCVVYTDRCLQPSSRPTH